MALAGLTITVLDKGAHDAHQSAAGMIAGAVGMVAYAAAVVPLLRRMKAVKAAAAALGRRGSSPPSSSPCPCC